MCGSAIVYILFILMLCYYWQWKKGFSSLELEFLLSFPGLSGILGLPYISTKGSIYKIPSLKRYSSLNSQSPFPVGFELDPVSDFVESAGRPSLSRAVVGPLASGEPFLSASSV